MGFTATAAAMITVSLNPTLVTTDVSSTTSNGNRADVIWYFNTTSAALAPATAIIPVGFPVTAGEVVYVAFSAGGGLIMYYQPAEI
jgi:hypothetical protein